MYLWGENYWKLMSAQYYEITKKGQVTSADFVTAQGSQDWIF